VSAASATPNGNVSKQFMGTASSLLVETSGAENLSFLHTETNVPDPFYKKPKARLGTN
jgi:hypothetical protein